MMNKFILITAVSFALSACNNKKEEELASIIQNYDFIGTWALSCVADSGSQSHESLMVMEATSGYREDYYDLQTNGCNNVDAKIRDTANVSLPGTPSAVSGTVNIDFPNLVVTLTPMSNFGVTYYNTISYCGFNDWALNVPKTISGLTCGTTVVRALNSTFYHIQQVSGTTLRRGLIDSNSVGTTINDRPTQLSSEIFQKQ